MYEQFYGLNERPFSITPNPRFVYLSQRHQDALAHLLYGVGQGGSGGFVQLTGEVGTGKTTLCRLVLEQVPEHTRIALILNPMLDPPELLRAICDELELEVEESQGLQALQKKLNAFLLDCHGRGERVVLIIDEAQNMSREALEQIRLLTNLETATDKLLQIILLGQPELRLLLARPELRQLAQRITARYHLDPLNASETAHYVRHRLAVAGSERGPFSRDALKALFDESGGVPRLINIIADRALMAGYAHELDRIDSHVVHEAAREVAGDEWDEGSGWFRGALAGVVMATVLIGGAILIWAMRQAPEPEATPSSPAWMTALAEADLASASTELASRWPELSASAVLEACRQPDNESASNIASCRLKRGSWRFIESLGLPVILRLEGQRDAYLVVVGMNDNQVLLGHQGQEIHAPLMQLDRRWLGEFLVAWPDDGAIVRVGDAGPVVEAMKTLAAAVDEPAWAGPIDDRYGERFENWVERFQSYHGLRSDGMIGPETRLFLGAPRQSGPQLFTRLDGVE
ncbi:MAG: AAA family ATPase [Pseudomonadota bacterium]